MKNIASACRQKIEPHQRLRWRRTSAISLSGVPALSSRLATLCRKM
jgi:hypothetical protein